MSTDHPWRIVAVAVLAQTLALMDNTILNVALETLGDPARGLAASPTDLAWIVDSYSLVLAAGSFAGGGLADRYGPRRILIAGLALLAGAALAAAFCTDAAELIWCRGFMGAGSALITPATLAIVTRSTTPAERARAIAVWASSGGLAVAVGPVVGGALLTHFRWGSVFLLNLPVAALGVVGAYFLVPELRHTERRRLDLPGVALTLLGLGLLVYGDLAAQSAEATRALAGALNRPDLLAAANRAYLHAMGVTALWAAAATLTGALLVIRCLRSQESALEAPRGHRPASLTDTAHRG